MSEVLQGELIKAADVPVYNTSIVAFSQTALLLSELTSAFKDKKYEVATTTGMEDAKKARAKIREVRYALEKFRKQEKADILARGKAIDTDAKYLEEHLLAVEEPIDEQIKVEEERKAREKAEKERIEKERTDAIRAKINAIKQLALDNVGQPAAVIELAVDLCKTTVISKEEYAEFAVEADEARGETLLALAKMLGVAELLEKQQAEVKAQQEELERQRAEQKQREKALDDKEKAIDAKVNPPTQDPPKPLPPAAVPKLMLARTVNYTLPDAIKATLPWKMGKAGGSVVSSTLDEEDPGSQGYYGGKLIFESCEGSICDWVILVMNQLA